MSDTENIPFITLFQLQSCISLMHIEFETLPVEKYVVSFIDIYESVSMILKMCRRELMGKQKKGSHGELTGEGLLGYSFPFVYIRCNRFD